MQFPLIFAVYLFVTATGAPANPVQTLAVYPDQALCESAVKDVTAKGVVPAGKQLQCVPYAATVSPNQ